MATNMCTCLCGSSQDCTECFVSRSSMKAWCLKVGVEDLQGPSNVNSNTMISGSSNLISQDQVETLI